MKDVMNEVLMNKFLFLIAGVLLLMTLWFIFSFAVGMFRSVTAESRTLASRMRLAWGRFVSFFT